MTKRPTRYTQTFRTPSTKDMVANEIAEAEGGIVSGAILARKLGITRPAVWKHVQSLIKMGVPVEAVRNGGYRMMPDTDVVLPSLIQKRLNTVALGQKILFAPETGSTNDDAKFMADGDIGVHGTVLLVRRQVTGKGRLGRVWRSPEGGIFLSVILRPTLSPVKVPALALVAGYSAVLALNQLFDLEAQLKWPNDVLVEGKKIVGVLCEMRAEIDIISHVIVGIGINANIPYDLLPQEVRHTAATLTALLDKAVDRNQLVAAVLNNLEPSYDEFVKNGLGNLHKPITQVSAYLNQPVVIQNKTVTDGYGQTGTMRGIDSLGRLILEKNDGATVPISAGDLSLRPSR